MHHWPELVAPQRQQLQAARGGGVAVEDDVATPLGQVFDLEIRTDQDRQIVMHEDRHCLALSCAPFQRSAGAKPRSGDVTARPADASSTPGRSQSPSGRMIT